MLDSPPFALPPIPSGTGERARRTSVPISPHQSPSVRFDAGVDADDDGRAVDFGLGDLVAVAAGDRECLAGGRRTRGVQRDFDVEDVVLDGGGLHV